MKRIYMTLGLMAALTTGAFAQTDLSITSLYPANNEQIANVQNGDTLRLAVIVTNEGPDALDPADTIVVAMPIDWTFSEPGYVLSSKVGVAETNLGAANTSDTFYFNVVQGRVYQLGNGQTGTITIPSNAIVDEIEFQLYGFMDSLGQKYLLDDPGTSVSSTGQVELDGNNIANPQGVTFGTVGIQVVSENAAPKVYPNPIVGAINFSYNVKATGKMSATVTDVTGRIVIQKDFATSNSGLQNFALDGSSLSSGTYLLEVSTDNERAVSKFTVK